MAYDFHYTPTGTGVISGKEVLEQTEDAINDLGNTAISGVQEALDKAEQALTNSENAVDDAQTALNTANNAEGVAIQAQTDVGNLSGTVTNIGNRVTTAEGNISNLQGRMTTAEGNITNLQGRMTTAETNIGNLQTAVSTAQATANSAQQTATTARQQSYVFRYSGTAITDNSTIAYSTIDNTDNIKEGDKILDVDGKLFEITAVDTTNQTVTVGSALIDLALDANVVHTSGNENIGGIKNFSDDTYIKSLNFTNEVASTSSSSSSIMPIITTVTYTDQTASKSARINLRITASGDKSLYPHENNQYSLGLTSKKWSEVHATNYYYGSSDVEFSDKFVTTDTTQTISGNKTFSSNINVYNSDSTTDTANIILKNSKAERGSTTDIGEQTISFLDKDNAQISQIKSEVDANGVSMLTLQCTNSSNSSSGIRLRRTSTGTFLQPTFNNGCNLGTTGYRWYDVQTRAVNNLEPSSLSLPSGNANNVIDISSYITALDGTSNSYTVPANGWISIAITGTAIAIVSSSWSDNRLRESSGNVRMLYPVLKNETLGISVIGTTLAYARFIPCQGNV